MQPEEYEQLDDHEKVGAEQPEEGVSPWEAAERRRNFKVIEGGKSASNEIPGGESNEAKASSRAINQDKPKNFADLANRTADTLGDLGVKGRGLLGKRKLWMGLGIGGGSIGLIIGAFIALAPLKLEHMLENIIEKRVKDKAEYMLERRMDKMVIRFLFEQVNASTGAGIYTDSSLLKTMYGNWKLGKFEEKFLRNTGYRIERVVVNGRAVSGIRLVGPDGKIAGDFSDPDKFEKFLGNNRGLDARRAIRQITRDQTKWYQIYQRRNLRRFMRSAYGIRKWTFFKGTKGNEADAEVRGALIDEAMDPYKENVPKILDCALEGTSCQTDTGNPDQPYGEQDTEKPKSATNGDGDKDLSSDSSSAVDDAANKAKDQIKKGKIEKGLSKVLSTFLSEELSSKIASKAVPVAGQILLIDQAARINHFFGSGQADKSIRAMHKVQYATLFTKWKIKDDNFRDSKKQMSGEEVNSIMNLLSSAEGAAAYQDLVGGKGGKKLDQGTEASDTGTPLADAYNTYSTPFIGITGSLDAWYATVDAPGSPLGAIIKLVNKGLGDLAGLLVHIIPGASYLVHQIGSFASKLIPLLIKPAVDGTEIGADLFNAIDMGGAVVGQDFARVLGGHLLSLAQTNEMNQQIAFNKTQDQSPSFKDKLFSPERSDSLITKLAMLVPTTPGVALNQFAALSANIFCNPFSFTHASNIAYAADGTDTLHGLLNYGATPAELDQSLDDDRLDEAVAKAASRLGKDASDITPNDVEPSDCPDFGQDKLNLCRTDLAAIQSGNPMYTKDDDGGISEGDSSDNTSDVSDTEANLPDGEAKDLANKILHNSNIELTPGASKADIEATAHDGVTINKKLLQLLLGAAESGFKIHTEIMKTGHRPGTLHGLGRAMDVQIVNDRPISGSGDLGAGGWNVPMLDDYKRFEIYMVSNNKGGEFGVPNSKYLSVVKNAGATDAFIDKGTGPHFHIGVNE
jgi:hypothetical protein